MSCVQQVPEGKPPGMRPPPKLFVLKSFVRKAAAQYDYATVYPDYAGKHPPPMLRLKSEGNSLLGQCLCLFLMTVERHDKMFFVYCVFGHLVRSCVRRNRGRSVCVYYKKQQHRVSNSSSQRLFELATQVDPSAFKFVSFCQNKV